MEKKKFVWDGMITAFFFLRRPLDKVVMPCLIPAVDHSSYTAVVSAALPSALRMDQFCLNIGSRPMRHRRVRLRHFWGLLFNQ